MPPPPTRSKSESTESLKILVIDDCAVARAEMTDLLSANGYTVSTLASPIGASRVIATEAIDVVVIDVQMPSIRGDRLAALFRGNPKLSHLGVILVTGSSEKELQQLAVKARADFIVSKARLRELPIRVRDAYSRHRRS